MRRTLGVTIAAVFLSATSISAFADKAPDAAAIAKTYADIAEAGYADSLSEAKKLKSAVDKLIRRGDNEQTDCWNDSWHNQSL